MRGDSSLNGRIIFAGAVFLLGVGLIIVLRRVGAPPGLARGLGPMFFLAFIAVPAFMARSSRLGAFLAADRNAPTIVAALAFAAIAAGLALAALGAGRAPAAGAVLGLALAALIVGPALRAGAAVDLSDFLTTRFPGFWLGNAFAALLLLCPLLLGVAGFELALEALLGATHLPRQFGAIGLGALMAFIAVPGGVASVIAACAAAAGALLGLALAALTNAIMAPMSPAAAEAASPPALSLWLSLALAFGIASQAALALPAIVSPSRAGARRAGAYGLTLLAIFALSAARVMDAAPIGAEGEGFILGAQMLAGISLAATGAFAAARAFGLKLTLGYSSFSGLATTTLARLRLKILGAIIAIGALALKGPLDPASAIALSSALSLAFVAPLLLLALAPRAGARHAMIALSVALAALVADRALAGALSDEALLQGAFGAGLCGLFAGGLASLVAPDAGAIKARAGGDQFVELPSDHWE